MFMAMKSEFTKLILEKDRTIASLSARVTALEAGAKKKDPPSTADNAKMKTDMEEYSSSMKTMKETVAAQQKTLENLQQDRRARNIVITGIKEPECTGKDAKLVDESAVDDLLAAVECVGISPSRVVRLGVKQNTARDDDATPENRRPPLPRPLLVSLNTANDVRAVLLKTNKLKNNADFCNIYVKRDEHPLVRQEWKRLRAVARKEKAAPINQGCVIKVDYQKKAVTRDGEIIQEFVSPFRLQGPNASA